MKIGVIGLGLIGGSIFKALREKYDIIGISRSVKEKNTTDDYSALKDCDLVFVCTPMDTVLTILEKLESILDESAIVTDVSSVKTFVSKKKYKYKFIPSHPMAGTEHSGWVNSFPELFKGAKWAITPIEGIILPEQDVLEYIINQLGAEVVITSAEEHDRAVALISHMPLIIAQALCKNIENNKLAQELASSGFRDTTRLALSNLDMANSMLEFNEENIKASINSLKANIDMLLENNYLKKAELIKDFRKQLF